MAAGYPSIYPQRARQLHGAGWRNCTAIARLLKKELGRQPGQTTIRRWVDEDYAEVVRSRQRKGGVCGTTREKTWQLRHQRVCDLHTTGCLSPAQIAAVMGLDFGLDLSPTQVHRVLNGRYDDDELHSLLTPKGAGE